MPVTGLMAHDVRTTGKKPIKKKTPCLIRNALLTALTSNFSNLLHKLFLIIINLSRLQTISTV
ncbi:MAG: hypothetical protein D6743_08180 [Calditrichaeota bacterium]|nr:MAG: hypothetical protein D6743_08180 [Calditrichota bacterium]